MFSEFCLARLRACALAVFMSGMFVPPLCAQQDGVSARVEFRVNEARLDPNYGDNARQLDDVVSWLRYASHDSCVELTEVSFSGAASPEGSREVNQRLARLRLESMEAYIRARVAIPDSLVHRNYDYIHWDWLRAEVAKRQAEWCAEVLAIIDGGEEIVPYRGATGRTIDRRVVQLQQLREGQVWPLLLRDYFGAMRMGGAVTATVRWVYADSLVMAEISIEPPAFAPPVEPAGVEQFPMPTLWTRHCYLKTNAVGWGMLISNIAFEVELTPRWSLSVPIYYSALNYFSSRVKFRTSCIQPELRYWTGGGAYVGVHASLAHFNYALGGGLRRQDHDGKTPAWGGGLSGGYRKRLDAQGNWWMELTAGVGVYRLHYDKFLNRINGPEVGSTRKTFLCIDNLAVTFAYRFDLNQQLRHNK